MSGTKILDRNKLREDYVSSLCEGVVRVCHVGKRWRASSWQWERLEEAVLITVDQETERGRYWEQGMTFKDLTLFTSFCQPGLTFYRFNSFQLGADIQNMTP